jgi:predicted GNAT superfamily acetyltransferase
MTTPTSVHDAWRDADAAAAASGIEIRTLHDVPGTRSAEALMMRVWGTDRSGVPLTAATMRALAHAGNYVAGAFAPGEPDRMVGCVVGFFGPPSARVMHSHVAAVDAAQAGSGVGAAMKLHQRAWCLDRGVERMTWTFDPVISRNAHFNIRKLGARAVEYLEDFYGPMGDGLNAGLPSDRLLVEWTLADPFPAERPRNGHGAEQAQLLLDAGPSGGPVSSPVDPRAESLSLAVPRDFEALRRTDPSLAAQWRQALRDSLAPLVGSSGWSLVDFTREGRYVVERRREDDRPGRIGPDDRCGDGGI